MIGIGCEMAASTLRMSYASGAFPLSITISILASMMIAPRLLAMPPYSRGTQGADIYCGFLPPVRLELGGVVWLVPRLPQHLHDFITPFRVQKWLCAYLSTRWKIRTSPLSEGRKKSEPTMGFRPDFVTLRGRVVSHIGHIPRTSEAASSSRYSFDGCERSWD